MLWRDLEARCCLASVKRLWWLSIGIGGCASPWRPLVITVTWISYDGRQLIGISYQGDLLKVRLGPFVILIFNSWLLFHSELYVCYLFSQLPSLFFSWLSVVSPLTPASI